MQNHEAPPEGEKPSQREPKENVAKSGNEKEKIAGEDTASSAPEPAFFPRGFWKGVDYLLHHPEEVLELLRRDRELGRLSRIFFIISLIMAAIYGAVMGATNLLQGSIMPLHGKLLMILITGIKVPALFLLTLIIVFPPIYVSNAFVGVRLSFQKMLAVLLASIAISSTVLASTATVAFFFSLTTKSYNFIKLLHVFFFMCAGYSGLTYLFRCIREISPPGMRQTPGKLFVMWLLLYIFVGTQLAWVLRPFVGSPNERFQLFRPRKGNFYESVLYSTKEVFTKIDWTD
jgi:hypothetical protein